MSGIVSNYDLLIPVVVAFIVMRMKSVFNVAQRMLFGLSYYADGSSQEASDKASQKSRIGNADSSFQQSIERLRIGPKSINASKETAHFFSTQVYYTPFESLVYMAVCTVLGHCCSMLFHSVFEGYPQSSWIALMLWVTLFLYLQSSLQIVYLTGLTTETKAGIAVSVTVFLTVLTLLLSLTSLPWIAVWSPTLVDALQGLTLHATALTMQSSTLMAELVNYQGIASVAVMVAISTAAALITLGTTIPVIRFSHTFMTTFTDQNTPISTRCLLVVDYLLPLPVGCVLLMNLLLPPFSASSCDTSTGVTSDTCTITTAWSVLLGFDINGESLDRVRLCGVLAVVVTRIVCMKSHLQCFLDTNIRVVTNQVPLIDAAHSHYLLGLKNRVQSCNQYLSAAAAQYINYPMCLLVLVLLLKKAAPPSYGATIQMANTETGIANTTAIAIANASMPYLTDIVQSAVGGKNAVAKSIAFGGGTKGATITLIRKFIDKLAVVAPVPWPHAEVLLKACLGSYLLLWFALSSLAMVIWTIRPSLFLSSKTNT